MFSREGRRAYFKLIFRATKSLKKNKILKLLGGSRTPPRAVTWRAEVYAAYAKRKIGA